MPGDHDTGRQAAGVVENLCEPDDAQNLKHQSRSNVLAYPSS
jgi:hypothetical protein